MRLNPARVAVALAAPAGVVTGHLIGYLPGDGHSGAHAVDHGYLPVAAALVAPLVVAAVLWAAMSGARSRPRPPAVGLLLVAQWTLFTAQEMVEHAVAGHGAGEALRSPAVRAGLAAQVLVALALAALLRVATAAGARAVTTLSRLVRPATVCRGWGRTGPVRPPASLLLHGAPSRGPPPVLA